MASSSLQETIKYCVAIIQPQLRRLMVLSDANEYVLPCVRVALNARPAEQINKAVHLMWGLQIFILEFVGSDCAIAGVVAEGETPLIAMRLEDCPSMALSDLQRNQIATILRDESAIPLTRIGWIDEAIQWVENASGQRLTSPRDIEQYNAGGGFSLLRLPMKNGSFYWLKATGKPNAHELTITRLLSKLAGTYLPTILDSNPSWNAWIVLEGGHRLQELPEQPASRLEVLGDAVESMAQLQIRTAGHKAALLAAGAVDHEVPALRKCLPRLFAYLEEAMAQMTSLTIPRVEAVRLHQIHFILERGCDLIEQQSFPETILHGDMSLGNIVRLSDRCQFIDWCEAYIGHPFITLEHLLLLARVKDNRMTESLRSSLISRYEAIWCGYSGSISLDHGMVYMPLLAMVSTLYGRGDWIESEQRNESQRQAYARNLARRMDEAARAPALLDVAGRRLSSFFV